MDVLLLYTNVDSRMKKRVKIRRCLLWLCVCWHLRRLYETMCIEDFQYLLQRLIALVIMVLVCFGRSELKSGSALYRKI